MRRLAPLPLMAIVAATVLLSLNQTPPASAGSGLLAPRKACKGQLNAQASVKVQERAMRCLINYARSRKGLSKLGNHLLLDRAANAKARDIVRCRQFSHYACGRELGYWVEMGGYSKCSCSWAFGENIAWAGGSYWGKAQTPRNIMNAWLHSSGHRHNILTGKWRDQGVGLIKAPFSGHRRAVVWASLFGVREGA